MENGPTWRQARPREKGCGMKKCSLSLCIAMSLILICGMDIETNPGPMQTRLTAFEQKDTRNTKSQEQGSNTAPAIGLLK